MRSDEDADRPFLGRGWAFPLRVAGGDVATAAAEKDIEQSIHLILETAPGERVMRPDFGVGLRRLVCAPVSHAAISQVRYRIEQALLLWEPRIETKEIRVRIDPDQPGVLLVELRYLVRATNTIANLVYPFYLTEDRQA